MKVSKEQHELAIKNKREQVNRLEREIDRLDDIGRPDFALINEFNRITKELEELEAR